MAACVGPSKSGSVFRPKPTGSRGPGELRYGLNSSSCLGMRKWGANGLNVMILETRAVAPFFKNGFVVGCEETREGILIDPGDEVEELLAAVGSHQLTIRYILLTHAHIDHVTGVGVARTALGVPVGLHKEDLFLYKAVEQQGQMFGIPVDPQPDIDFFYDGSGPWRFGRYGAWVHHTPGHCP